jgi:hypothetical protein
MSGPSEASEKIPGRLEYAPMAPTGVPPLTIGATIIDRMPTSREIASDAL